MLGKMIVKSLGFTVLAAVVWNLPMAQDFKANIEDLAANAGSVTSLIGNVNPLASDTSEVAYTPVGRCSIKLVVDPQGAPKGSVSELRHAAATLTSLTGMTITVSKGTVEDNDNYTTVPVKFLPESRISDLYDGGAAYALTETKTLSTGEDQSIVTKGLYINKDAYGLLSDGTAASSKYIVLLHELGHVAGLDHSDSATSLMARTPSSIEGVSEQDLAALRAATASCR